MSSALPCRESCQQCKAQYPFLQAISDSPDPVLFPNTPLEALIHIFDLILGPALGEAATIPRLQMS